MINQITNSTRFDRLFMLGDTHGRNKAIQPMLCQQVNADDKIQHKVIIHVGDFGIGFCSVAEEYADLSIVNRRLAEYNTTLYVIRGNHDDPKYFLDDDFKEKNSFNNFSNIILLKDHTLLSLNIDGSDVNVYCNGGAISIDRMNRTIGSSYWIDETFNKLTNDQLEDLRRIDHIDIIVTHSRPTGVWPYEKFNISDWLEQDDALYDDLIAEGNDMKLMFDVLKDAHDSFIHYYGHFHESNTDRFNYEVGSTKKQFTHRCLLINELAEFIPDTINRYI